MPLNLDRLFRGIWLANGILLLLLAIGLLGVAVYGFFDAVIWDDPGVQPITEGAPTQGDLRPRAIRYDEPERLLNSPWRLVQVRYGTDYAKPGVGDLAVASTSSERAAYAGGPLVNVMFFLPDSGVGRLLLDRPAYIRSLDFAPEHPRYAAGRVDTVPWITYSVAFDDTDGNDRLDDEDAAELYISDLDGSRFRRVLPAGFRVTSTQVLPDHDLLVLALDAQGADDTPQDQLPQRAFRFSPRTGELTSDAVLDSLAADAGRLLGRPTDAAAR
jgi:hypothetical protein